MIRLLESLRLWQKALLPIALCAMVATGLSAKLLLEMSDADKRYTKLLDRDAVATVWATRMNASAIELDRMALRGISNDAIDYAAERREIEALNAKFTERAQKTAAFLAGTPHAAKVPEFERAFASMLRVALEANKMSADGQKQDAIRNLRQNFDPMLTTMRLQLENFANAVLQEIQADSDQLTIDLQVNQRTAIYLIVGSVTAVLALGLWIALRGVVAPLKVLALNVGQLAEGKFDTQISGASRGDEIGGIARAIETFRATLLEAERRKAEQEAANQRTAEVENAPP